MSTTVIVLCPRGRRQTVHTNPNASLLSVLEEACRKQKLESKEYQLRHGKTILDLTLNLRYANLPNNCKLEIEKVSEIRQDGKVKVGLQLESGERFISEFSPNESLYQIMAKWSENLQNELENSAKEPIMIYLRREIVGIENFKSTTLRNLGLTGGNAALRLIFRDTGLIGQQAHVSSLLVPSKNKISDDKAKIQNTIDVAMQPIQSTIVDENPNEKNTDPGPSNTLTTMPTSEVHNQDLGSEDEVTTMGDSEYMEVDSIEAQEVVSNDTEPLKNCSASAPTPANSIEEEYGNEANINILGERGAMLFNLEDIHPISHADLPDDFFELNVDDIKYLMRDLKTRCDHLENKSLETEKMRQNRKTMHLRKYKKCYIRIQFPDRMILQGTFLPNDTVLDVYNFVKNFMDEDILNFNLFTAPPKHILNLNSTLLEVNLVPTGLLYFGCEESREHYLQEEILNKVSSITDVTKSTFKSRDLKEEKLVRNQPSPKRIGDSTTYSSQMKKVPRWFKKP